MRCLDIRSDLMVAGDGAQLTEYADRYVLRTPQNPNFWYGNATIFKAFSGDPTHEITICRQDHPDLHHCCVQWDIPQVLNLIPPEGFTLTQCEILQLKPEVTLRKFPMPTDIIARALSSDDDWAQAIDLQIEIGIEQGYSPAQYPAYARASMAKHRKDIETGRAAWFGAFDGPQLVADMGIYVGDGIGRYQSVETRQSHRRRGICRALLGHAHDWARAQDQNATQIIVADAASHAGRTYRACGFCPAQSSTSLVRGSW